MIKKKIISSIIHFNDKNKIDKILSSITHGYYLSKSDHDY
jgi:hypothetical protein